MNFIHEIHKFFSHYFYELGYYLEYQWAHMSPGRYFALLIGVGALGWFLMRNRTK
jgi:hypothetical protein